MTTAPSEPLMSRPDPVGSGAKRLSALARYWWLTALRGLIALRLGIALLVAGRGGARLITFIALYWLADGLITIRFALAIRPRRGSRLGLTAGLRPFGGAGW